MILEWLGRWISTLVLTLLAITCFQLCCMEPRWGGLPVPFSILYFGVGAVDLDACADAARPSLASTLWFKAALGRLASAVLVFWGWGSGSRRLCGRCSTFPSFGSVVQSRVGAAWGRLFRRGRGQSISMQVRTLLDLSCFRFLLGAAGGGVWLKELVADGRRCSRPTGELAFARHEAPCTMRWCTLPLRRRPWDPPSRRPPPTRRPSSW
jgi:hypothetical protein